MSNYLDPRTGDWASVDAWDDDDLWVEERDQVPHPRQFDGCTYAIKVDDKMYISVVDDRVKTIGPRPGAVARVKVLDSNGRPLKEEKKTGKTGAALWDKTEAVLSAHPRVLLYGPPGTGKTTSAVFVDEPRTLVVTLTEETPAAELRGHYIPRGNEFEWHDGIAVRAWRDGLRLVLNEPDRGSGDVITFLYAIADDPAVAKYTLPTGETVRPHPNFQIVMTMNGDPTILPPALQDRFSVKLFIDEPHPAAIAALPADLQDPARKSFLVYDDERSLSVRSWKEFGMLREELGDADIAAWAVFGDRAVDVLNTLKLSTGI